MGTMQLSVSCSTRITSQAITSKDSLGTMETPRVEVSVRQWLTGNKGEIKTTGSKICDSEKITDAQASP